MSTGMDDDLRKVQIQIEAEKRYRDNLKIIAKFYKRTVTGQILHWIDSEREQLQEKTA